MCLYLSLSIYIYIHINYFLRFNRRKKYSKLLRTLGDRHLRSPRPGVSFHNFKSQIFKLSVSNPRSKYVAYLSVLSQISNCQSLGSKNKHEILKTDRRSENMVGVNVVLAESVKFKHGLYQSCGIECFEGILLEPCLMFTPTMFSRGRVYINVRVLLSFQQRKTLSPRGAVVVTIILTMTKKQQYGNNKHTNDSTHAITHNTD